MRLFGRFMRERTRAITKGVVTFNAPGIYQPPYGSRLYELQGRGSPGNPPTGGNYAGTNPSTGGNYAGVNPGSGGNYAGTNPSVPGNIRGYNPPTGGNYAGANPPTPGNVSGYNPPVPGNPAYQGVSMGGYYYTAPFGSACPLPFSFQLPYGGTSYIQYSCINAPAQPASNGNPNFNPTTPGNPNYNPYYPGNALYNPTTPGNYFSNPYYPGNPRYNPTVPGNAYYNPYVPGNAGTPSNVLGVPLPGGAAGSAAPVVGYVPINLEYSSSGVPVAVPLGGYVQIKNS